MKIAQIPGLPAHIGSLMQQGIEIRLNRTKSGDIYIQNSLFNIVKLLAELKEYRGRIIFDDFSDKVVFVDVDGTWQDFEDQHANDIRFYMEDRFYTSFNEKDIFSAAEIVAKRNRSNVLLDHIKSIKWDEQPRVEKMLIDYFGVEDNDLNKAYSKRFMISIIARMFATIHNPVKVDTTLVLYGTQGQYKSTALSILALDHKFGRRFFQDTPFDMGNKDAHLMTQGKIIVELQELAKRSKDKEIEKSFLSLQIAKFRGPYKRCVQQLCRKCVFVATTNKNLILTDATGSRRFWVVTVGAGKDNIYDNKGNKIEYVIDLAGLRKDIDQLYAEAYKMYTDGEQWWLTDTEEIARIKSSADYTDRHPLYDIIKATAERLSTKGYVKVAEIIADMYNNPDIQHDKKHLEKSTRQNKAIITDVLLDIGYKYSRRDKIRGWRK